MAGLILEINFAIPARKTQEFLNAKVAALTIGNTTAQAGKFDVPIRVEISDPLQRVGAIRMQYWADTCSFFA